MAASRRSWASSGRSTRSTWSSTGKTPTNSKVNVEIEAASLDSNHAYRDNWARSEALLDVWKFRTINFESTKIEKTGENTGKMTGNLTMHGVTQPVTMDVTYNKAGMHLSKKYSIDGFTAKGKLKRSDFGMSGLHSLDRRRHRLRYPARDEAAERSDLMT